MAGALGVLRIAKEGFDLVCAEFWMGHTAKIDNLKYNEFWKHNPEGVRRQYLIAETYLTLNDNPTQQDPKEQEVIRALQEEVKLLSATVAATVARLEQNTAQAPLLENANRR